MVPIGRYLQTTRLLSLASPANMSGVTVSLTANSTQYTFYLPVSNSYIPSTTSHHYNKPLLSTLHVFLLQTSEDVFDGVPVRIYRPDTMVSNGPALVWIHGGGWVWGSVSKS